MNYEHRKRPPSTIAVNDLRKGPFAVNVCRKPPYTTTESASWNGHREQSPLTTFVNGRVPLTFVVWPYIRRPKVLTETVTIFHRIYQYSAISRSSNSRLIRRPFLKKVTDIITEDLRWLTIVKDPRRKQLNLEVFDSFDFGLIFLIFADL